MNPILSALLYLVVLILFGVALLTGGCSVLFTPSLFLTGEFAGSGLLPIWGAGLAIAAGAVFLAIVILRRLKRPAPPKAQVFDAPDDPPAP